jgi:hypothetical protein
MKNKHNIVARGQNLVNRGSDDFDIRVDVRVGWVFGVIAGEGDSFNVVAMRLHYFHGLLILYGQMPCSWNEEDGRFRHGRGMCRMLEC